MSDHSSIEWTETTWNPISGCTRVSPGCDHCYIERTPPFRMAHRKFDKPGIGGTTGVLVHSERFSQPLRWRKPRRVFVNSLSDLFHDDITDDSIARVFETMALTPKHTYQILTKRPARMRALLTSGDFERMVGQWWLRHPLRKPYTDWPGWPLPNVWLGVTTEDQRWADIRIPILLGTPAAVRWVSYEPAIGALDLGSVPPRGGGVPAVDWVVCGGETGSGSRPMHPQWARDVRDQCVEAGVPYFFKQWGDWCEHPLGTHRISWSGEWGPNPATCLMSNQALVSRVGKTNTGRLLDGREWNEYPQGGAS